MKSITFQGQGVHSNRESTIQCIKTESNGIRFIKSLDGNQSIIPCNLNYLEESQFQINLRNQREKVQTVEHLLSALYGLGIHNMDIHCSFDELPILDGSAYPFVKQLQNFIADEIELKTLPQPLFVGDDNRYIIALPHTHLSINSIIQFDHPLVQHQRFDFTFSREGYIENIAPARTFGFLRDWENLKQQGYALGSSTENTLIYTEDSLYNPPLRFENEAVRHKILDIIAILSFLPQRFNMEIFCFCSGHNLDIRFLKELSNSSNDRDYDNKIIQSLLEHHFDFDYTF